MKRDRPVSMRYAIGLISGPSPGPRAPCGSGGRSLRCHEFQASSEAPIVMHWCVSQQLSARSVRWAIMFRIISHAGGCDGTGLGASVRLPSSAVSKPFSCFHNCKFNLRGQYFIIQSCKRKILLQDLAQLSSLDGTAFAYQIYCYVFAYVRIIHEIRLIFAIRLRTANTYLREYIGLRIIFI